MLRILGLLMLLSPLAAEPPDRKALKIGLATSYFAAPDRPAGRVYRTIEPTVAIYLQPGESVHPDLEKTSVMIWEGFIQIVTPGDYTFSAQVQSGRVDVRLTRDGQTLTALENQGPFARGEKVEGKPVRLDPGFYEFRAQYECAATKEFDFSGETRRLELWWQGPGFVREPIPYFFFSHLPSQRGEGFDEQRKLDHGRYLFEELACDRCHKSEAKYVERTGPNLAAVGERVHPGWLDAWLADPAKLRPHTTMPRMFDDSEKGREERHAVVQFLLSLSTPLPESKAADDPASVARGGKLFTTIGCAACHGDKLAGTMKRDEDDDPLPPFEPRDSFHALGSHPQARYDLGKLGSKTTAHALAAYLKDPLKTNPHGRMPNMRLADHEARDLAEYLTQNRDDAIPKALAARPGKTPAEWAKAGREIFKLKGCGHCHSLAPHADMTWCFPEYATLKANANQGCLADKPKFIAYSLTVDQREALRAFVTTSPAITSAPAYQARTAMKRFNCLACHLKDGEGGIGSELAEAMKSQGVSDDDVSVPRLTGIGHKATTSWLDEVLSKGGRARPWMPMRMPQYGPANVGFLPKALAACEGVPPMSTNEAVKASAEIMDAGRKLAGKDGGLGCVACHDIDGRSGGGTRGADLALTTRRVRQEWFYRWLHNPQRLAPGTKMPSNFTDNVSVCDLLGGDGQKQAEALWAYLQKGPGLPLPAGVDPAKPAPDQDKPVHR